MKSFITKKNILFNNIMDIAKFYETKSSFDDKTEKIKFQSLKPEKNGLNITEEFSEIPKYKEIKANNDTIKKKVKNTINFLKKEKVSDKQLEEFVNIEKYIKYTDDVGDNKGSIYMDVDYVENIRKQHEVIKGFMDQITLLQ